MPSQNHSQNSMFRYIGGFNSCYIGNQPLYFQWVTLSKIIRAQEGVPTPQSGPPTRNTAWIVKETPSQNHPKNSMICFIFIEWPWSNLLELKRGFPHHKVAPWPRIQPGLAKTTPSQNHTPNSTFRYVRGSDGCDIGNNQLYFHQMTLRKVVWAQDGFPTPESGFSATNTASIDQRNAQPKSPQI